jgi:hypothetical protein
MAAKHIIKLKDYLKVVTEYPADTTITPGTFIALNSDGEVVPVANEEKGLMVADYDGFQGKTINDAYVAGAMVQCWIPQRGDVVYAVLAASQTILVGDQLAITTGGVLKKKGTGEVAIAIAEEAVTTESATGRVIARII